MHTVADQMRVLAPGLPAHHIKSFHALGITHHFTANQGFWFLAVLFALLVVGAFKLATR